METVRLILKLAVGFHSIFCAVALWGLLLLPAPTTSGWMIWKQSFNCWLPRTSKNRAFGFFRSNAFPAEPLLSMNSFSVSAVMWPYSIFTLRFLQVCVYRNVPASGALLFHTGCASLDCTRTLWHRILIDVRVSRHKIVVPKVKKSTLALP